MADEPAHRLRRTAGPGDGRPGALQLPVHPAVEPAACGKCPRQGATQALPCSSRCGAYALPRRCYHRASLRLLFRSSFRRAREGLFHAPIPAALAGRPRLP
jgi:hypothetical protein